MKACRPAKIKMQVSQLVFMCNLKYVLWNEVSVPLPRYIA